MGSQTLLTITIMVSYDKDQPEAAMTAIAEALENGE